MAFDSFAEFIAMGGHGAYVWSSWVITLLLILGLIGHARLERRQLMEGLMRRARREQARQAQDDRQAMVYPVDQEESS